MDDDLAYSSGADFGVPLHWVGSSSKKPGKEQALLDIFIKIILK
jgi:hypothetical protein